MYLTAYSNDTKHGLWHKQPVHEDFGKNTPISTL